MKYIYLEFLNSAILEIASMMLRQTFFFKWIGNINLIAQLTIEFCQSLSFITPIKQQNFKVLKIESAGPAAHADAWQIAKP